MIGLVGRRLASSIGLLLMLVIVQRLTGEAFVAIVAVTLIALVGFQWLTAVFFTQRSVESPDVLSLRIRAQDAVALAVASTVGGLLGVLVILRALHAITAVDPAVYLIGISFALLMIASPAVNWFLTWRPWA
jgi:hypothetical protein